MLRCCWLTTAACLMALAGPALADDWPQFRRDAGRSAASADRLALPLAEIWSRSGGACAVWQGKTYFTTTTRGGARLLVCADARTGTPLWRQLLNSPTLLTSLMVPPVVSSARIVYVYDAGIVPDCGFEFFVRGFDAVNGRPLAATSLACGKDGTAILRLFLLKGHGADDQAVVQREPPG